MSRIKHKCADCSEYKPDVWYSPTYGRWLCDECCEDLAEEYENKEI